MFALWLLSRASEGAEAALAQAVGGFGAGCRSQERRGCSGSHLGISANDNCALEVSHAGSSKFGKTGTPTALPMVGGGLGDGFMAFKCPPPPAS